MDTLKFISILKDRAIPVEQEVIVSVFDDRNAQWASEHLRPDTLLSKDELALYVSYPIYFEDITNRR
jgi:hypothetical protein